MIAGRLLGLPAIIKRQNQTNMKQRKQLQIPEPCHENWDKMTSTQQGRFCMSCQKEVVDFSVMSDKDILNYISTASTNMCGRVAPDQLNRDLIAPREPRKIGWRHWISVAASLILITSKTEAQVKAPKDTVISLPPGLMLKDCLEGVAGGIVVDKNYKENLVIKGTITDENGNPLPAATILIKGTKKGTISEPNGKFSIAMQGAKNNILQISSIGYETREVKIPNHGPFQNPINIALRRMTMGFMGDVVITAKRKRSFMAIFKKDSIKCEQPFLKQAIKIFPNPVLQGADIKLQIDNMPNGNYNLVLYDISGNAVLNKQLKIDSNSLIESLKRDQRFAPGIYVININGNGKSLSTSCVVQ